MGRKASVWFFADRDGWYTTVGGHKVRVADGNVSEKEANRLWHEAMVKANAHEVGMDNLFRTVAELYLETLDERNARSYDQSRRCLTYFCKLFPKLRVSEVTGPVLLGWLSGSKWNPSTKNLHGSIVKRVLGWAARPDVRLIERNPLQGCPLPTPRSRGAEAVMTADQQELLIRHALPNLADAMRFLGAVGCRPITLCRLERSHYLPADRVFRLEQHKTQEKTGRELLVPVPVQVAGLVAELCLRNPEGPLFRTSHGKRWTPHQLWRSMVRLQRKLKRKGLWQGPTVSPVYFRHTVATVCLREGMTDADVAAVLGHSSTAMVHRHYSHVKPRMSKIVDRLEKATGSGE